MIQDFGPDPCRIPPPAPPPGASVARSYAAGPCVPWSAFATALAHHRRATGRDLYDIARSLQGQEFELAGKTVRFGKPIAYGAFVTQMLASVTRGLSGPSFADLADELEGAPLMAPPAADVDERPLHITLKSTHPIALCGFRTTDEFNPGRTDTAGRDRCATCLAIAAARGLTR